MVASTCNRLFIILLVIFAPAVLANNVTISGAFDGTESTMAADPASCDGTPKRYRQIGSITVSASGNYEVVDAGNNFFFTTPAGGIADAVVMLYTSSFNAASPATNRLASIDDGGTVALASGTTYIVVVQHWCVEMNGPYAVIIDGAGTISGAGFTSFAYTVGEFLGGSPTADFPGLGVRRYVASAPTNIFRPGTYYFGDLGGEINGNYMQLRIYQNAFDPNNPALNLVANTEDALTAGVSLKTGVSYIFVAIDLFESVDRFQFVLFPPGPFVFNPGLNAAWVADGVGSQGIFMEVFPSFNIVFFAHFTFVDAPLVQADGGARPESDQGGKTSVQTHLGSDDQIWLTAFGTYADNSNTVNLKYENSTGGRFNSTLPVAVTDSNYGTGYIEGFSCERLLINWTLPGGIIDTREYVRLLPDGLAYCESFLGAAPVAPPF